MQIGDTDNLRSYLILTPTPKKPNKGKKTPYSTLVQFADLTSVSVAVYICNNMNFCTCVLHVANLGCGSYPQKLRPTSQHLHIQRNEHMQNSRT